MSSSSCVPELQKRQDAIDEQIASLVQRLSRSEAVINSNASASSSSSSLAQYEDTVRTKHRMFTFSAFFQLLQHCRRAVKKPFVFSEKIDQS